MPHPFHLAHNVTDRAAARAFYGGQAVPMPRLGVVRPLGETQALAEPLTKAGTAFDPSNHRRFERDPGEQATMVFRDPAGNPFEINSFESFQGLFATCGRR